MMPVLRPVAEICDFRGCHTSSHNLRTCGGHSSFRGCDALYVYTQLSQQVEKMLGNQE